MEITNEIRMVRNGEHFQNQLTLVTFENHCNKNERISGKKVYTIEIHGSS